MKGFPRLRVCPPPFRKYYLSERNEKNRQSVAVIGHGGALRRKKKAWQSDGVISGFLISDLLGVMHWGSAFLAAFEQSAWIILFSDEGGAMGLTKVTVTISDLARSRRPFVDEFLVDTGAVDCLVPASKLKKAGVKQEGKSVYELANGEPVEYPYGFARVSFMGSETVAQVIFGPENAEPILGVVALENTGIGVDPRTKQLHKMTAKALK
jgi:clan AA aspartic protease